ncbi:DHH family phosphoesterase [Candidatus Nomurabacteria bacterium]|nr:DHH family phosphoesterase [Candidatus Nomurabacteria bacterium]
MNINARLNSLLEVLKSLKGQVSILITQVDPDALASAMALRHLCRQVNQELVGSKLKIFYCGSVSHPQNRAVVYKFELGSKMLPISAATQSDLENILLVDSSSMNDGRIPDGMKVPVPKVVVDHHRGGNVPEGEGRFVWVEDIGACSTMFIELLQAHSFDFSHDSAHALSTMLAIGVHTDTGGLINCGKRDRTAFTLASENIPSGELARLFSYPLPQSHFAQFQSALIGRKIKSARLVTGVGIMSPDEGDILSTISDLLIRTEGVTLVVVWGVFRDSVGKAKVRISARNTDNTRELGAFLRERFGSGCGAKLSESGQGIGGGMLSLDLGDWLNPSTEKQALALVEARIESAVLED